MYEELVVFEKLPGENGAIPSFELCRSNELDRPKPSTFPNSRSGVGGSSLSIARPFPLTSRLRLKLNCPSPKPNSGNEGMEGKSGGAEAVMTGSGSAVKMGSGGGRSSEGGGEGEAGRTAELGRGEGGVGSTGVSGSDGGVRFAAAFDREVVLREIETEREGGFEGARAGEGEGEEGAPAEEDDAAALAVAEELASSRWAREEGRAGRG